MRICVVSYDYWGYDAYIVEALRKKNVDAVHISLSKFGHKNSLARIQNAFSKVFLKKNLKNIRRKQYIFDRLDSLGKMDQILVINPELFDRETHEKIKSSTNKYIAYLYDSVSRNPVEHLLDLFDEIFSFDKNDVAKYNFQLITNYNYLPEHQAEKNAKYDLLYLASFDDRLKRAEEIAAKMGLLGLKIHFRIIGKKAWKKKGIQSENKPVYTRKKIHHDEIPAFYKQGKAILDLVRDNQKGLSFRIFEAMALKKKIVTDNETVKDFDFYNPGNILVLNKENSNLNTDFFESEYQELPEEIYSKYTVESWVERVFNIK